ncbi:LamG domain-containing protein [bacterium]|nr:LamG domain-containing protein [bacterium]
MTRTLLIGCLIILAATLSAAAEGGLVAHWSFDEGTGDVARDLTGHGHDAALKNTAWVPSPRGHALRFDGKDDVARYGELDSMNLSGDLTLAVWLKTDSSVEPKTNRIIIGDTGLGVERNLNLRMDGYGYLRFEWADGTRNASLLAPNSLLNGTWKHVVVTCASTAKVATMYVDGQQVAQMPMPLPISKAPTKERLTGWFYNGYFQGDLDDIRLYSRALTAAEVTELFQAGADLQIGKAQVLCDADAGTPAGVVSVPVRNWSQAPRDLEVAVPGQPTQRLQIQPGAQADVALGHVPLTPLWRSRTDLFLCEAPPEQQKVTFTTRRGDTADVQPVDTAAQLVVEPLQVHVLDAWQKQMKPGRTDQVRLNIALAMPMAQVRRGAVRVVLVSRETRKTALTRQFRLQENRLALALNVEALPWGAYEVTVSFVNGAGREVVATQALATVLPTDKQQLRVLNNLVTELMDAQARGLLGSKQIAFMNPRHGWVWFSATGQCGLKLDGADLLTGQSSSPVEAMRLLPAGKHVLTVSGVPTAVQVRAVPALLYNVYPSSPQIAPFGANTWERLRRHTLPNMNMIEAQVVGTPEQAEWTAQGKLWIANIQAPGLLDKTEWTAEKMLEVWLNPGKPTAWAPRPGYDLTQFSGLQIDEYDAGMDQKLLRTTAQSVARLAEDPAFRGKMWIPFVGRMYGNEAAVLFHKATVGAGWPFSIEVYLGESPTEQQNAESIAASFVDRAQGYEHAYPGSIRQAIFTPMYAYLPYCTTNCYPQADFRVHLDMQMNLLANHPAYFGLWGVQPYRSNYVDEEILNCMGRLLRHYCLEGKTERLLTDPYELRHVTDPDFVEGTKHWQVAPAEEGGITAGAFKGYGILQGRYPGGAFGDTFALLKRSAKGPNVLSQELQGLKPGRLYSLKVYTGDYADLKAGKTRKDQQVLAIGLEGAEVQPGGFAYPFRSARGPQPFTMQAPLWMTYHWLQFRAQGPTARLSLSDWAKPDTPGGPVGQEMMVSFVEVQPVLETP